APPTWRPKLLTRSSGSGGPGRSFATLGAAPGAGATPDGAGEPSVGAGALAASAFEGLGVAALGADSCGAFSSPGDAGAFGLVASGARHAITQRIAVSVA
ncbi:MAG TPA: hypothetical protein VMS65_02055, partial [Polyangiaceae bacterium]|nr:hypothetical protein [Polyangiaceae bacterium]